MAKKKTQVEKFYDRERELKEDVLKALRKAVGDNKISLEDTEQEFEDDANNTVVAIDRYNVYTDGEIINDYPIHELSTLDALYILGAITN